MLVRGLIYEVGTAEVDEKCVLEFQPHARDKSRSWGGLIIINNTAAVKFREMTQNESLIISLCHFSD